ncbi:helix-turn-helix domain-containing protein [Butyrivibrio sp. AE3004]|uniref:helix-turn-helix domain-containing protein n=1 Tax=Butyrivibrio sp. AE3004 TaxID=1506994 RepID=UPI000A88E9AD|nr:helix-turn-helix transcriptional regulator [Butyrivibrio sp. AE3004]
MEPRTGIPIEKWDEVNGTISAPTQNIGAERDTNVMPMITGDVSQGERFTQLREQTGMNRKEFAEYLDIPYRTMSDWENNLRTMPAYVFSLIEYKVRSEFGIKLPQELDPNTIGNVRRGLEDQIEQNDNMIGDGIINNTVNVIDDNANGIPDEDEKLYERQTATEKVSMPKVSVKEKEEKTSLLKMLHDCKPEADDRPHRQLAPELVL